MNKMNEMNKRQRHPSFSGIGEMFLMMTTMLSVYGREWKSEYLFVYYCACWKISRFHGEFFHDVDRIAHPPR